MTTSPGSQRCSVSRPVWTSHCLGVPPSDPDPLHLQREAGSQPLSALPSPLRGGLVCSPCSLQCYWNLEIHSQQHKPPSSVQGFLLGIQCLRPTGQARTAPTPPGLVLFAFDWSTCRLSSSVEVFLKLFLLLFSAHHALFHTVVRSGYAFPLQVMLWAVPPGWHPRGQSGV